MTREAGIRAKGYSDDRPPDREPREPGGDASFLEDVDLDVAQVTKFTPYPGTPATRPSTTTARSPRTWDRMNAMNFIFIPHGPRERFSRTTSSVATRPSTRGRACSGAWRAPSRPPELHPALSRLRPRYLAGDRARSARSHAASKPSAPRVRAPRRPSAAVTNPSRSDIQGARRSVTLGSRLRASASTVLVAEVRLPRQRLRPEWWKRYSPPWIAAIIYLCVGRNRAGRARQRSTHPRAARMVAGLPGRARRASSASRIA
jgi:hypothetical protein